MKRFFIVVLLLITVMAGCGKKTDFSENVINIDLTKKIIPIQKAGIIKSFDIVRLKTPDDVVIGEIDKVILYNDRLYITDDKQTSSIYVFDMEGSLLRTISHRGRGPGEYLNIGSIFIDEPQNTFNILNTFPAKILSFGLNADENPGVTEFKDVTLTGMRAHDDKLIGYTVVSSKGEKNGIHTFDHSGKQLSSQLKFPDGWESNNFGDVEVFSSFKSNLYVKPIYDHIIYKLNGETFEPVYSLDFGNYNWPSDVRSAEEYRKSEKDFIKKIYQYQETEDYWIFHFVFGGQKTLALWSKKSGETQLCSLTPNESPYFISFGTINSIASDHIITCVEAHRITNILDDEELTRDFPESVNRLKEKFSNINDNDNPAIIIYRL